MKPLIEDVQYSIRRRDPHSNRCAKRVIDEVDYLSIAELQELWDEIYAGIDDVDDLYLPEWNKALTAVERELTGFVNEEWS